MIFDTGAGSLASKGVFLNESGPSYDPSESSTSKLVPDDTYKNCYASGHCGSGVVYNDIVSVGNLQLKMNFEVSTDNNGVGSGSGDSDSQGGDFGMAYAAGGMGDTKSSPTFLEAVEPKLGQYLFTVDYDRGAQAGTVNFGFIDQTAFTSKVGYLPINANYYWGVNFTGYAIGSGALQDLTWTSVVDTGTAGTHVPPAVVRAYCAQVTGATYNADAMTCQIPCSATPPNFVFGANDHRVVIPGKYLLPAGSSGSGKCTSTLLGKDGSVIFGQSFIQAQFLIFDHENARVGFANKGA